MIVGEISKKQSRKPLEIVFKRAGTEVNRHPDLGFYSVINVYQDESFHILIDLKLDMIQRWGTFDGLREEAGEPGEGTTIDIDEPFMLRWVLATYTVIINNKIIH